MRSRPGSVRSTFISALVGPSAAETDFAIRITPWLLVKDATQTTPAATANRGIRREIFRSSTEYPPQNRGIIPLDAVALRSTARLVFQESPRSANQRTALSRRASNPPC